MQIYHNHTKKILQDPYPIIAETKLRKYQKMK